MKIGDWKLKILSNRGEIATILTVVTLGLMLVGTVVGTKLAEKSTEQRTEAKGFGDLKTQALSGCQIVDTDLGPGCWCSKGDWQGHCFAGGKRGDKPSQLCRDNCSSKNGSAPAQNITPPPTGGGDQTGSPTGANCNLNSSSLSPAVGNQCGNCVVFKSGDLGADSLRKSFDNWGFSACNNNQIVSYWCNGAVSKEGKNTCQARLTECKATSADCTGAPGANKYPLPGQPAPTAPPPGGSPGGPGGSNGGDSGGGSSTDQTKYYNGYYILKGTISDILDELKEAGITYNSVSDISNIKNPSLTVSEIKNKAGIVVNWDPAGAGIQTGVTPEVTTDINDAPLFRIGSNNDNYIIIPIANPIAPAAETMATIKVSSEVSSTQTDILQHTTERLKICYPFTPRQADTPNSEGVVPTARPTPEITDVERQIINKCSGSISDISFKAGSSDIIPTITPTPAANIIFKVKAGVLDEPGKAFKAVVDGFASSPNYEPVKIYDDTDTDIFLEPNYLVELYGGTTETFKSKEITPLNTDRKFRIIFGVKLESVVDTSITPAPTPTVITCTPNGFSIPYEFTVKAGDKFTRNNSLGVFEIKRPNNSQCIIIRDAVVNELSGSSNDIFREAIERWVKGEMGVLQMSSFISQLTRAPGLQISFCDPRKGECNPTF